MTICDDIGRLTIDKTVQLKPYVPRSSKVYELMTDAEIMVGAGGTLIVDTESYINYFLIAFKDVATKKIIKFESTLDITEDKGIDFNNRQLSWIMHSYRTIGFNSIKYDLPMIWMAYYNQDTDALKQLSNDLIFSGMWHQEATKKYNFTVPKTDHIDLIEVCPLKGSLKLYGARLHSKRIQDLPFPHDEPLTSEQIKIVSDYCVNDLDNTELEFENLLEPLKLRMDLSVQYKQDLMSKSDAQIAEAIISSELKSLGTWPKKPKIVPKSFSYKIPTYMQFQTPQTIRVLEKIGNATFSTNEIGRLIMPEELRNLNVIFGKSLYRMGLGGLHSSEKNVRYLANDQYELSDRDVASYYPAVILNQGLYPEHLGPDFLKVYQTIVDRRLAAKKAKNISVSECLKICINGTFGKTGSPYSILYSPDITIQITLTGQLALIMLIEQMELAGIQVISANTDGILIYCRKDQKEACGKIVAMWEQITGFVTEETKYKAYYARDVNAYLAVKEDNTFKGKNDYYDPWRGKTGKDQYWKFQKNPTVQICIEAIEQLIAKDIPVQKTIQECRDITKFISITNVTGGAHKDGYYLGRTIRWYYAKNVYGTINYIKNNNKVSETDGAKPLMDLPDEFPEDIDYDWYVKHTDSMLFDLNYYQRAKQISFF